MNNKLNTFFGPFRSIKLSSPEQCISPSNDKCEKNRIMDDDHEEKTFETL